jgi:3',5'-cyclic AMP phosphodiesterase CpdA
MTVRLLHMSDIHFGSEDAAALAAATAFAETVPFDLLVLTGDLTQFGEPAEFASVSAWLADLPGPKLSTPGNHDTPWMGLVERLTAPFQGYATSVGPPDDTGFHGGNVTVRMINSARGWQFRLNWSKGEVSRRQVNTATARFWASPPNCLRVLACHHPLVEPVGAPMTGRVRGGRFAAQTLVAAGVDVVLTGHLHVPFVEALPYGDGMSYAVGAGTLSVRERGARPGFNVIETAADALTVTAMAWTGQTLEVEQTWRVPLRRWIGDGV